MQIGEKMKKILIPIIFITFLLANDISGVSYFNFSEDNGFGLSRTYFTYQNEISEELSFTFQTDVGKVGDDDRWTAYLKKAQLDWKIENGIKISMGLIGMNMFNVQEKTWGNRFIAKSALDYADWGVAAADLGIGFSKSFGNISTSLLMTNGEGYKHSVVDDKQKISLQVLYGEKRLDKNNGYNVGMVYSNIDPDPGNSETVRGFFGGWSNNNLVAGAEYYTKGDGIEASLMSVSMNYILSNNLTLYIRQDSKDPNIDTDDNETDTLMAGFIWAPTKGLKICPNMIKVDDDDETYKINFEFKF